MALKAPDMSKCTPKRKCCDPTGENYGTVYDPADPCEEGQVYNPLTCDCFDSAGYWRINATAYIGAGGAEGYLPNDGCTRSTPALRSFAYKDMPDNSNTFAFYLESGGYLYVSATLTATDMTTSPGAPYYRTEETPTGSTVGVAWNKTATYIKGSGDAGSFGYSTILYLLARDKDGNRVGRSGSGVIATAIRPTDTCSYGPNGAGDSNPNYPPNPTGYRQWIEIGYEKWDENLGIWVPTSVPTL